MSITCNMDKNQRTAYYAIGIILIVGAVLEFSKIFAILLGLGLVVEAYLGWCSIPFVMDKISKKDGNEKKS